ncbi:MAG: hypothetical protein IPO58_27000 [Betaproteobacteria bacterium]|nr:hypothetical protein [Betaproteobacteria bacterium]
MSNQEPRISLPTAMAPTDRKSSRTMRAAVPDFGQRDGLRAVRATPAIIPPLAGSSARTGGSALALIRVLLLRWRKRAQCPRDVSNLRASRQTQAFGLPVIAECCASRPKSGTAATLHPMLATPTMLILVPEDMPPWQLLLSAILTNVRAACAFERRLAAGQWRGEHARSCVRFCLNRTLLKDLATTAYGSRFAKLGDVQLLSRLVNLYVPFVLARGCLPIGTPSQVRCNENQATHVSTMLDTNVLSD